MTKKRCEMGDGFQKCVEWSLTKDLQPDGWLMSDIGRFLKYFLKRSPVLYVALLAALIITFHRTGSVWVIVFGVVLHVIGLPFLYFQWKRNGRR